MSEPLTREELDWIRAQSPKGTIAAYFAQKALNDLEALESRCDHWRNLAERFEAERNTLRAQQKETDSANLILAADKHALNQERGRLIIENVALRAQLETTAKVNASLAGELVDVRARCEHLEQLYSHKDLDFECAERGCKSKKLTARCEQLEAALRMASNICGDVTELGYFSPAVDAVRWVGQLKAAMDSAAENSTIASESTG